MVVRAARRVYRKKRGVGVVRRRRYPMRGRVMRSLLNPTPAFTETYAGVGLVVPAPVGAGGQFSVRITDLPQLAQYTALYRQYKINWVKVMLIPDASGGAPDINQIVQNQNAVLPFEGMGRIAWVINDTPALAPPANEDDVLTDNGCKIRPLKTMWSCSFRPRPDAYTGDAAGGAGVATREKSNQWLSFAAQGQQDPLYRGVSYWITLPGGNQATMSYNVYYKVNFSLRDPK